MKTVEAIYEHGRLKLLERLPLAEHQHVWLAILADEPTPQHLAQLAAQSPSFHFLADPTENVYSLHDGRPL